MTESSPEVAALRDAARRLSDAVTLHITAIGDDAHGKWVAARLTDGSTDGTLYDTRIDAIQHQTNPEYLCYVFIPPGGMGVHEAEVFLKFNRALFDAGMRMPHPEREYVIPQSLEHHPGGQPR